MPEFFAPRVKPALEASQFGPSGKPAAASAPETFGQVMTAVAADGANVRLPSAKPSPPAMPIPPAKPAQFVSVTTGAPPLPSAKPLQPMDAVAVLRPPEKPQVLSLARFFRNDLEPLGGSAETHPFVPPLKPNVAAAEATGTAETGEAANATDPFAGGFVVSSPKPERALSETARVVLPRPKPAVPDADSAETRGEAVMAESGTAPWSDFVRPPLKPEPPPPIDPRGQIVEAANMVARVTGVTPGELIAKAAIESSFDPMARASTSSAAGPFQFIERTWLDMIRRHGAAYGLAKEVAAIETRGGRPFVRDGTMRDHILDLRFDIHLSTGMAARYLDEVGQTLGRVLGREVSPVERRMAYFLGPGGAAKLIGAARSNPHGSAAALLPHAARANQPLFYSGGRPLSNSDALDRIRQFTERHLERHAFQADERRVTSDEISAGGTLG